MPAGTPYGRTALPTKVVDAAELTSLTERMQADIFRLGASHRADQDAESLAQITLPETGITGATGYEGMLEGADLQGPVRDPSQVLQGPVSDPSQVLQGPVSDPSQALRPSPMMAMPEAPSLPQITPRRMAPEQGQSFELPGSEPAAPVSFTATPGGAPSGAQAIPFSGDASPSPAARGPSPAPGGDLHAYARAVASQHGIDPDIFERQIQQESGFNPQARSPAGAQGIAQFMPQTAKGVGLADPFEPYSALSAAAGHMADNLANNGGDYARALAAYNAGQGAVNQHGGVPPFAETQRYVSTILGDARPTWSGIPGPATAGEPGGPPLAPGPVLPSPRAAGSSLDTAGITQTYRGVPYVFGGAGGRSDPTPGAATDCSGFVSSVWKSQYGLDLAAHTDTSYNQLKALGATDVAEADARPGDVVYYMGAGTGGAITHHMGIYAGPGKVLDMSVSGGDGVRTRDIGHAGRHVILRDPRVNAERPQQALAPPPIVPSGDSGGQPISHADASALQLEALSFSPTAISGDEAGMAAGGVVEQPYDPDQGPREALPGSVGATPYLGPMSTQPEMVTAPAPSAAPFYQPVLDAGRRAVSAVQAAYAVPEDERPPQYSGPSYAQPAVPEGQRPYFAPTETESAAVSAGLQHAAAAAPLERIPIPFTSASVPVPGPLQGPAGAVAGGLEVLGAADQAVRARIDPRVWGFARDGIAREILSPDELARWTQLGSATHPDGSPKSYADYQAEQVESQAVADRVEARYQQIKDDPDALTRYANASPAYAATSAVTDIALTPALGAAAGGAATRAAGAVGASTRSARAIGYGADIAAQTVIDPTTPFTQGPLDAAVAGLRTVGRGVRGVADTLTAAPAPSAPGVQHLGSGVVPELPSAAPSRLERLSPAGRDVMETYARETPARTAEATARSVETATQQLVEMGADPAAARQIVEDTRAAIERNLGQTKVVATGLRPGALNAYLRGGALGSKTETGDLDQIIEITRQQVNAAGKRMKRQPDGSLKADPYTTAEAADFVRRQELEHEMVFGGHRFPDATGARDTTAPNTLYAYVSDGQPLVGPNAPTVWGIWHPETPRVSTVHHQFALGSPDQDIHAAMPDGYQRTLWSSGGVDGGVRHGEPAVKGAVVAADPIDGQPILTDYARVPTAAGRGIADTPFLVGPAGEDAMRANSLILSMPDHIRRGMAVGTITDAEQAAAVLQRGGGMRSREYSGFGASQSATRTESLIADPNPANLQALYITGPAGTLERTVPTGLGTGGGKGMTVLETVQATRAKIKADTGNDIPIYFNNTSEKAGSKLITDAQLIEGPPIQGGLAPGRAGIVDQYRQAINPKTKEPYANIGSGVAPGLGRGLRADAFNAAQGGVMGAASEDLQAQQEGREADPAERWRRALIGGGLAVAGGRYARPAAAGAARLGSGVVPSGGLPPVDPDEIADLARRAADTPVRGPRPESKQTVKNVASEIKRQADAGIPPEHPEMPMTPPNPPPSWWDHAENWRYNIGLFAQLATGAVQAVGGAVTAVGGGTAEALRLAVLRGQGEALPIIAGEGIKAVPGAVGSSLRTIAGQVPKAIEAGSDYRPSLHAREFAQGNVGRGAAALAVGTPGRTVTQAPDAFWHELFYRSGIAQAAADVARSEFGGGASIRGVAGGVAGGAAGYESTPEGASPWETLARTAGGAILGGGAASVGPTSLRRAQRTRELIANPTPEILEAAAKLAQDATYKGEPGAILGAPKRAGRAIAEQIPSEKAQKALGAAGSFLMPIYNTIARIHEEGLKIAPGVGMLPLDQLGLGPKGAARPLDRKLAQQAVGLAFGASALGYAASGGIRGPGPSNTNEAQAMRDQGYTPNTTNVAGYWVPNAWFGEYGPYLNEIGAINDARLYDHGDKGWDDLTWEKKAEAVIKNSARAARDYPALDAVSTLTGFFTDPVKTIASFTGEVAAQYVPGPIRTKALFDDPKTRARTRGEDVPFEQQAEEAFRQRSGIGRETLPAAQDILGRDVPNRRQGWAALAPNVGQDRPDPIIQAYLDADLNIGDPPKQLTVPGLTDAALKPELTPEEARRWNTLRGEGIIRRVSPAVADPAFAAATPDARQKYLERQRLEAAEEAHARLRVEIGTAEINRRITEAQRRKAG